MNRRRFLSTMAEVTALAKTSRFLAAGESGPQLSISRSRCGLSEPPSLQRTRVLIVTGGHGFDEESFFRMYDEMPGICWRHAELGKGAETEINLEASRNYDVIVFYDMYKDPEPHRKGWLDLLRRGKGMVFLHHALASYGGWEEYLQIVGGHFQGSIATPDIRFRVRIADTEHPITQGLQDFEILDETYKPYTVLPDVNVLLTTDHPTSEQAIGWNHSYGNSPVVYFELGHGPTAFENPNFRELLRRAVLWTAGRLHPPSARDGEGFHSMFNGENLLGWQIEGELDAWSVHNGLIRGKKTARSWLRSARIYHDVVLRLEYRLSSGGTAGVLLSAPAAANPHPEALAVALSAQSSDWHRVQLQCRKQKVEVAIDGRKPSGEGAVQKRKLLPGYIGLEQREGMVEFRNIRIREEL